MMRVKQVKTAEDWRAFLNLSQKIYADDPYYVAPLTKDIKKQLDPQGFKSEYVDFAPFIVVDGKNQTLGRIVPAINRRLNEKEKKQIGLFGYFESIHNHEVVHSLIKTAIDWVKKRGAMEIRGPINLTTHNQSMFLRKTRDHYLPTPTILMPYNPSRYCDYMQREGFQLAKTAYAYDFPINPLTDLFLRSYRIARKSGIVFRPVHLTQPKFSRDLRQIYRIFRQVFSESWSSSWQSEEEFFENAASLRGLIDPSVFPVAEYQGQMVGFFLTLPDYNFVLHKLSGKINLLSALKFVWYRRKISGLRAIAICVLPEFQRKMVAMGLIHCLYRDGIGSYQSAELSWVWQDNKVSRRIIQAAQAKISKEYGIFSRQLETS